MRNVWCDMVFSTLTGGGLLCPCVWCCTGGVLPLRLCGTFAVYMQTPEVLVVGRLQRYFLSLFLLCKTWWCRLMFQCILVSFKLA